VVAIFAQREWLERGQELTPRQEFNAKREFGDKQNQGAKVEMANRATRDGKGYIGVAKRGHKNARQRLQPANTCFQSIIRGVANSKAVLEGRK
jgi:hypothetical protein